MRSGEDGELEEEEAPLMDCAAITPLNLGLGFDFGRRKSGGENDGVKRNGSLERRVGRKWE